MLRNVTPAVDRSGGAMVSAHVRVLSFFYGADPPGSRTTRQPHKPPWPPGDCATYGSVLTSWIVGQCGPILLSTATGAIRQPPPSATFTMALSFTRSPLDGCVIVDSTGTVLDASTCYLVDAETMPDAVYRQFIEESSDAETFAMAKQWGRKLSAVVVTSAKLPGER